MTKTFHYQRQKINGLEPELIPLSQRLILEQAELLGVVWRALPGTKIIELKYQDQTKYFRYESSPETTHVGFIACIDKGETKQLLKNVGISVSKGTKIEVKDPQSYWDEVFDALKKPLVVKPSHGMQGYSIFLNISDKAKFHDAVQSCLKYTNQEDAGAIVEEMFDGQEYRILTSRKKVLAAVYREPANVIGDGVRSIQKLIDQKNTDPRRGNGADYALVTIAIDDDLMANLTEQKLDLSSVPTKDQKIYLRKVSNISQGGDSIDVTDQIHPSAKELAVKTVNALPGVDFVGVDFMTKNIFEEQTPESYVILEVNKSPGFSIHHFPYQGKERNVAREFLYIAFPKLETAQLKDQGSHE